MNDFLSPQDIAERAVRAMFESDAATRGLGIAIDAVAPGYAKLRMTVREDMLNGHRTCHGGFIFSLADSAFAFGCNARNKVTVAQGCEIEYLLPGRCGDVLTAECREQAVVGRSGVYDIRVTNQDGRTVALFRGKSRRIGGDVVPGLTPDTEE